MDVDYEPFHVRLFARAPVYDLVFACLSPRSLVHVALTCRVAYLAVVAFKTRAFNVNRHFSRYFTNPLAFRSLQAKTNTLVSGSNALQFFDRTLYPESDLDVYTHPGHSYGVAQYLVETEGYRFVPRDPQGRNWKAAIGNDWVGTDQRVTPRVSSNQAYPTMKIAGVWTFAKTSANQERLKIQIIEGESSPLETILGFHSTVVMNFISADAAYSLYPIETFERRCSLGLPPARSASEAIQKYTKRGWRIYFRPIPNDPSFFLGQQRWVGDRCTWILPLDQTGIKKRPPTSENSVPLTFDPVLFNGWKLRVCKNEGLGDGYAVKEYEIHYYPLKSTMFRYNYAIPEERLQFVIRDWATHQGKYSHWNIDKEDWVWFDADLPTFWGMLKQM